MSKIERDDKLTFQGIVIESNTGIFKVKINDNHIVKSKLSGRIRLNDIKVIVGDLVEVEVSPYDVTNGRIVKRFKKEKD